jgi:hypothetical protein
MAWLVEAISSRQKPSRGPYEVLICMLICLLKHAPHWSLGFRVLGFKRVCREIGMYLTQSCYHSRDHMGAPCAKRLLEDLADCIAYRMFLSGFTSHPNKCVGRSRQLANSLVLSLEILVLCSPGVVRVRY